METVHRFLPHADVNENSAIPVEASACASACTLYGIPISCQAGHDLTGDETRLYSQTTACATDYATACFGRLHNGGECPMAQRTSGHGESMPTIYDVARAAGVSTSTVSHVINGTRYVSVQTT